MEQLVREATQALAQEIDRLTLAYQAALAKAALQYERGMTTANLRYSNAMQRAVRSDPAAKVVPRKTAKPRKR